MDILIIWTICSPCLLNPQSGIQDQASSMVLSLSVFQHFPGMFQGLVGYPDPSQHTGDLFQAFLVGEFLDFHKGPPPGLPLGHPVVGVGKAGDLGEVSDAKHLVLAGDLF
jgi:hypothetical protein